MWGGVLASGGGMKSFLKGGPSWPQAEYGFPDEDYS